MGDFSTEDVCFDTSKEGEGGAWSRRSPILCEGQSEGTEPSRLRKLRPYEEAGAPSTKDVAGVTYFPNLVISSDAPFPAEV
jgi:hypothetical protein